MIRNPHSAGQPSRLGALVLAGGESSRMGRDKASLPLGERSMLARVVDRIESIAEPIVVLAAPEQLLPELPERVLVHRDDAPHGGPLAALASLGAALLSEADAWLLLGVDQPAYAQEIALALFDRLGDRDVVCARVGGRLQPLGAVYSAEFLRTADRAYTAGERSLRRYVERARCVVMDEPELRADPRVTSADPDLASFLDADDEASLARVTAHLLRSGAR